ncbi:hypothetical protein DsansV1_C17g0145251 [Dioscorea sansibarensis]
MFSLCFLHAYPPPLSIELGLEIRGRLWALYLIYLAYEVVEVQWKLWRGIDKRQGASGGVAPFGEF